MLLHTHTLSCRRSSRFRQTSSARLRKRIQPSLRSLQISVSKSRNHIKLWRNTAINGNRYYSPAERFLTLYSCRLVKLPYSSTNWMQMQSRNMNTTRRYLIRTVFKWHLQGLENVMWRLRTCGVLFLDQSCSFGMRQLVGFHAS